jgi:hydroxypyruvate isomerase
VNATACWKSKVSSLIKLAVVVFNEQQTLSRKLSQCGLSPVLFNLPAGDWPAGDRGIACDPGRRDEFLAGLNKALEYARILGTKQLNCLAGIPPPGISLVRAEATCVENLRSAAEVCKTSGISSWPTIQDGMSPEPGKSTTPFFSIG